MKWLLMLALIFTIPACDNKKEESDAERKKRHEERYKTPPPSDRSKDKGF